MQHHASTFKPAKFAAVWAEAQRQHTGSAHGSTQAGELRVAWYSLFRGSDMLLVPLALLSVEHTRVGVPGLAPCCNTIRPTLRGTPRVSLRLQSFMRAPPMATHKLASSEFHGIRFSVLVSLVRGQPLATPCCPPEWSLVDQQAPPTHISEREQAPLDSSTLSNPEPSLFNTSIRPSVGATFHTRAAAHSAGPIVVIHELETNNEGR